MQSYSSGLKEVHAAAMNMLRPMDPDGVPLKCLLPADADGHSGQPSTARLSSAGPATTSVLPVSNLQRVLLMQRQAAAQKWLQEHQQQRLRHSQPWTAASSIRQDQVPTTSGPANESPAAPRGPLSTSQITSFTAAPRLGRHLNGGTAPAARVENGTKGEVFEIE
jgi:hypothetical protein